MILQVYADESGTNDPAGQAKGSEVPVVAGYIASADYWTRFCAEWKAALDRHRAPYFHFREFASKHLCAKRDSPYYQWNHERRDDFLYDLAMIAGDVAVPIGGLYDAKKHHALGFNGDPFKGAFAAFFNDVREAMDTHWPGCTDKVLFIFDNNDNKKWRESLHEVYDFFKEKDGRFGELTFEDDKDPKHLGLQAADMSAYATRQQGVPHMESGKQLQPMRILDIILNKNLRPAQFAGIHPLVWGMIINLFRADQKKQKREWAAQGLPKKRYYPYEHFPFEKYKLK